MGKGKDWTLPGEPHRTALEREELAALAQSKPFGQGDETTVVGAA